MSESLFLQVALNKKILTNCSFWAGAWIVKTLNLKTNESKTIEDEIEIPVQVNGKVRATIKVAKEASAEEIETVAFENTDVLKFTDGHEIVKKIYVPGRIYTVVVK